jgi:hypothetical protein
MRDDSAADLSDNRADSDDPLRADARGTSNPKPEG